MLLERPRRRYERRWIRSSVETAPIRVKDGIASVECRTPILVRVAERDGFCRVEPEVGAALPSGSDSGSASALPPVEAAPEAVQAAPALTSAGPSVESNTAAIERERAVGTILDGSVEALVSTLDAGSLDDLLAVAYVGERSGKNRVTAKRAILARSRRIGVSFDVP